MLKTASLLGFGRGQTANCKSDRINVGQLCYMYAWRQPIPLENGQWIKGGLTVVCAWICLNASGF